MSHTPEEIIKEVRRLSIKPGELLHVKVGISAQDFGGGQPVWLPTHAQLEQIKAELEAVIPEGAKILVTHLGYDLTVIEEPKEHHELA